MLKCFFICSFVCWLYIFCLGFAEFGEAICLFFQFEMFLATTSLKMYLLLCLFLLGYNIKLHFVPRTEDFVCLVLFVVLEIEHRASDASLMLWSKLWLQCPPTLSILFFLLSQDRVSLISLRLVSNLIP